MSPRTRFALPTVLAILLTLLCGCASHNSHRVALSFEEDLAPLIEESFVQLVDSYGQALPEQAIALAVDLDDVHVHWLVKEGSEDTSNEELRLRAESEWVRLLEDALVEQDQIPDSDLRFNAWVLVDLWEIDEAKVQVSSVLTHKSDPKRVLAQGWSGVLALPRLRCFGCRDHWIREGGTHLDPDRDPNAYAYGYVYVGGWSSGGWSGGSGGRPTYTKVR